MALVLVDNVKYLMAGSKNTCLIWPADTPSQIIFAPKQSTDTVQAAGSDIGGNVAALFSAWYLEKSAEEQEAMFREWCQGGMCTIMGELNRPWAEHLIPIKTLYLEVYSILGPGGLPIPPAKAFDFFSRHGIAQADPEDRELVDGDAPFRQVWYTEGAVSELDTHVRRARADRGNEGVVIYACGADDNVLGLVKIKTNEYVIKRRLRETLKGRMMAPLGHGEVAEVVKIGKERVSNKIRSEDPALVNQPVPLQEVIAKVLPSSLTAEYG